MYIEEVEGGALIIEEKAEEGGKSSPRDNKLADDGDASTIVLFDAKRVFVGAGARFLFYPTLLYNVLRNKIQEEFRWWDWIDEFVLLGAVPFCSDVNRLKELGVSGVITLNEPYETLVPTSLYEAHGICNLVLPTRDYLFAPSLSDVCQAVDFIHENASRGECTYVHCKAGRGRSTTIVVCYLVKYKQMTPDGAYDYVKSIRPRVLLASSQWQAVLDFYYQHVKRMHALSSMTTSLVLKRPTLFASQDVLAFDDGSVVVITKADLDGYDPDHEGYAMGNRIWANLSLIYGVRVAGGSALGRLSCWLLRCDAQRDILSEELTSKSSCSAGEKQLGSFTVDIHVY